ncbi:ABC transporter permease [Microbulbifer agarilyticus]|uniref:ABC transporter permease n=1 Tax=Microbulbifer agarilyticus TaxID=260552 RepID=UPI001C9478AF|nr:ABC transporter permease [Microbulbifer agarilyticus]MBY6189170.1 ABC transporter permease [Microbulbifer agarilyticus]
MLRNALSIIWVRGIGALKADSENSYLGTLWWVLEPLLLTALFYVAFSTGIRGNGSGSTFVYFLICGILPFKWSSSAITGSSTSINSNLGILSQFYLPKWIFPTAVNLSMFIRFMLVLPLIMAFLSFGGYAPGAAWIHLPLIVLCQLVLTLGLSYLTASLVPLIPDLKHLVSLSMTAVLFTAGIFFDIDTRPEHTQEILRLNPFASIIDAYRTVLLDNQPLSFAELLYPLLFGGIATLIGAAKLYLLDRYYLRVMT